MLPLSLSLPLLHQLPPRKQSTFGGLRAEGSENAPSAHRLFLGLLACAHQNNSALIAAAENGSTRLQNEATAHMQDARSAGMKEVRTGRLWLPRPAWIRLQQVLTASVRQAGTMREDNVLGKQGLSSLWDVAVMVEERCNCGNNEIMSNDE